MSATNLLKCQSFSSTAVKTASWCEKPSARQEQTVAPSSCQVATEPDSDLWRRQMMLQSWRTRQKQQHDILEEAHGSLSLTSTMLSYSVTATYAVQSYRPCCCHHFKLSSGEYCLLSEFVVCNFTNAPVKSHSDRTESAISVAAYLHHSYEKMPTWHMALVVVLRDKISSKILLGYTKNTIKGCMWDYILSVRGKTVDRRHKRWEDNGTDSKYILHWLDLILLLTYYPDTSSLCLILLSPY